MKETTITFRLDKDEKDKLTAIAKENDLSVSQLVRRAVKQYLIKED